MQTNFWSKVALSIGTGLRWFTVTKFWFWGCCPRLSKSGINFTSKLSSHYIFALTKGSWPRWPGHGESEMHGGYSTHNQFIGFNFLKLSSPSSFLLIKGNWPWWLGHGDALRIGGSRKILASATLSLTSTTLAWSSMHRRRWGMHFFGLVWQTYDLGTHSWVSSAARCTTTEWRWRWRGGQKRALNKDHEWFHKRCKYLQ